jgi:hypothetical protein
MHPSRALLPIAAALAVSLPSVASAVTWVKAGDVGKVAVWVDKDSIRRSGSQARATLEWRWAQPTEVPGSEPARSYRMERQVQIANCENRGYAVAEGVHYADERGTDPVNSYRYDESLLPYSVAPARTIRDAAVLFVCQASLQPASGK